MNSPLYCCVDIIEEVWEPEDNHLLPVFLIVDLLTDDNYNHCIINITVCSKITLVLETLKKVIHFIGIQKQIQMAKGVQIKS